MLDQARRVERAKTAARASAKVRARRTLERDKAICSAYIYLRGYEEVLREKELELALQLINSAPPVAEGIGFYLHLANLTGLTKSRVHQIVTSNLPSFGL